jgi:MerR family transcriptional regulator, copper efflux regulator
MNAMRISQLADASGVPATTLRYYESAGLLPAERTPAGYRTYGQDAVERLAFIGAAKHLGLPLDEIAGLLGVWQDGACAQVRSALRPRIAARLAEAETRVAELAAFTTSLRSALEHLDALPDRAGRCDPRCGFLIHRPASARHAGILLHQIGPAGTGRWRTAPIACTLDAGELRQRAGQWRDATAGATRTPIAGGPPDARRPLRRAVRPRRGLRDRRLLADLAGSTGTPRLVVDHRGNHPARRVRLRRHQTALQRLRAHPGRPYGGIFVAGSLLWGWAFDNYRLDRFDILGGGICLIGMGMIMFGARGH